MAAASHPELDGEWTAELDGPKGGAGAGPFDSDTPTSFRDLEAAVVTRQHDPDPAAENHYVMVIHGTFDSPPSDGLPTWYQPPAPGERNFCSKIQAMLGQGHLGEAAVWRALPCDPPPGIPYPFHWDGTNTHEGRVQAATQLHKLIDCIANADPSARIHLVAHSHGGNVLLKTVDLYLRLLVKQHVRQEKTNPHVKNAFWAAYRIRYESIGEWRQVHMEGVIPWWLLPFTVVWRSETGGAASEGDSYPWGYYQLWDTVLGLGASRKNMFLSKMLQTSPINNALGSLVFLGTPFYVKRWEEYGMLLMVVSTLFYVGVAYIVMTFYVFIWKVIIQAIEGKDPGEFFQQAYISFTIAAVICTFVLISSAIQVARTTVMRSGNLYHRPRCGWSPAMSALVVHAGKLDEASLVLSTEPVVRAFVFPQLTQALKQTPWQPLPKRPSQYSKRREWAAFFFDYFMAFFWDVLFLLPSLAWSLATVVIAPIITSVLQRLAVTASFGLAPGELNFAYVYVDEYLELEAVPKEQVQHWNVQKLLAEAKTRSLQGLMLEGYEDDTVEKPDWMADGEDEAVPVIGEDDAWGEDGPPRSPPPIKTGEKRKAMKRQPLVADCPPSSPRLLLQILSPRAARQAVAGLTRGMPRLFHSQSTVAAHGAATDCMPDPFLRYEGLHTPSHLPSPYVPDPSSARRETGALMRSVSALSPHPSDPLADLNAAAPPASATGRGLGGYGGSLREVVGGGGAAATVDLLGLSENGRQKGHSGVAGSAPYIGDEEMPATWIESDASLTSARREGAGGNGPLGASSGAPLRQTGDPSRSGGQGGARAALTTTTTVSSVHDAPSAPHDRETPVVSAGLGSVRKQDSQLEGGTVASVSQRKELGHVPPTVQVPGSPDREPPAEERLVYEFLWDDTELEAKASRSAMYALLKKQAGKIDRNPRLTQAEFERQLKAMCLVVEERLGELTGRVDLNHGSYFRDPRILKVISHFLTSRELPAWTADFQGDRNMAHLGPGEGCIGSLTKSVNKRKSFLIQA